ncbi:MAG: peptidyl-alpha-hydroxyglycine alpha-amidating lyase family protein [Vicinamibacterales bacterium]
MLRPALAAAVLGVTLGLGGLAGQTSTPAYHLAAGWAAEPGAGHWGQVPGLAIDAAGRLFAFHRAEPPIVELDADGHVLKTWGDATFVWPHGMRVDRDGYLWITDGRARDGRGQQVFKYRRDGTRVLALGTSGVAGDGPDAFNGPCDVAIGDHGDIFVADGHWNARIVKFARDGTFIKAWGRKGSGPGEFDVPHSIVIDRRGRLLVADRSNKRIQLFTQDGEYLAEWTQFGSPSGLFIDDHDTLYAVDYHDRKGVFIGSADTGVVRQKLDDAVAESVAVDAAGNIYVGETVPGQTLTGLEGGNRLRKFVREP